MNIKQNLNEILFESNNKNTKFTINLEKLYSPLWKIKQTIEEINKDLTSKTKEPIRISKIGNNKYFVLDGNHRVIEALMNNKNEIKAVLDSYIPDMTKTGGGYEDILKSAVQITSEIKNKVNEEWYKTTFQKYKLGNFSDRDYKGIAVGNVARQNFGASRVKNTFLKTY